MIEPDRPDQAWSGPGPSEPAPTPDPTTRSSYPAGWYPDPSGRFEYRWFNGTAWTGDVAADGRRFVDGTGSGRAGTPPNRRGNGLATAALTCGILAAVLGWIPVVFLLGAVLAVLAIVFGIIGLARARERGSGRGFAITGIVTGSIGILAAIVGAVFTVITFREVDRYLEPEPSTVELTSCEVADGRAVATGTIRNDGDRRAGFTVELALERAGSGVVERTVLVPIEELDPGEERSFETARAVRVEEIDCVIVEVTGPLPFGIDPGR